MTKQRFLLIAIAVLTIICVVDLIRINKIQEEIGNDCEKTELNIGKKQ